MLGNSGFVDDVMFSYSGRYVGTSQPQQRQQHHCSVLYRLTPLLRSIGRVVS